MPPRGFWIGQTHQKLLCFFACEDRDLCKDERAALFALNVTRLTKRLKEIFSDGTKPIPVKSDRGLKDLDMSDSEHFEAWAMYLFDQYDEDTPEIIKWKKNTA